MLPAVRKRLALAVSVAICIGLVIWLSPLALLFALPWIAAVVWVGWRAGWELLLSENGEEFPKQASALRGFRYH
jgi:hypothetical protein